MRESEEHRVCPFFNLNDARCAERFTLTRMQEVFTYCLGEHRQCEIYHQITVYSEPMRRPILAQAG